MMREILSILLAGFFLLQPAVNARAQEAQAQAASPADSSRAATIEQEVRTAALDSDVEVELLNKHKLRGRLKSVNAENFVLEPSGNQASGDRVIRFDEVESVKVYQPVAASNPSQKKSKISKRGKVMLVVGIAALVFGVVTYATTKGP